MNCPICQSELESYPDTVYIDHQNSLCPVGQDDKHKNTHYHKFIEGNWTHFDEIEEIALHPFRIKNMIQNYHAYTVLRKDGEEVEKVPATTIISCHIYKFNPNKFKKYKNHTGGFDRILHLPHHIVPDAEDKLRERIKLLLLLS